MLENAIMAKRFAGALHHSWAKVKDIENAVSGIRWIPSTLRKQIRGGISFISAGMGTLYNALAPPAPDTPWGAAETIVS